MTKRAMMVVAVLGLAVRAYAADVHVGINIGVPPPPPIVVEAPPPLVIVPRTPVYYAPDVPYNFFYYDGLYYVFHDGYWFSGTSSRGPWAYVRRPPRAVVGVPVRYYKVPPGHAKKYGPPGWERHGHGHGHEHGHGRGHGKHGDD